MLINTQFPVNKKIVLGAAISIASFAGASPLEGYATVNGGTTGGQGGKVVHASTGTEINEAICNRASDDTPIIIYVSGTINHDNTEKRSGSCDTTGEEIQFKKVSNISLIGADSGALFDEIGIHLREANNIILQNLHIRNVKKSGSPISNGGDAIGLEKNVFNVWIDHNTLEASGGESDGYDSLLDMKNTTQYVTVSYNKYYKSGRGGLMGSSDSDATNTYVTFHHNWYDEIDSRIPLLRHGTAHAYNNYYTNISKSAMNPRIGGQIKAENNHFNGVNNPVGTFYTDDMGYWQLSGNIFEDVTWINEGDKNHPAGPNPSSTATITVPYSYRLDDASCVESIVTASAGAGTGLAVSDGSCSTTGGGDTGGGDTGGGDTGGGDTGGGDTGGGDTGGGNTGGSGELGTNLSLGAGSDGSSKGTGSYGSVRDGDTSTYWSPSSSDSEQRISIKWSSETKVDTVVITEASGYTGNIGNWKLVNETSGDVIQTGSGAGEISFDEVSLKKLSFYIESNSGTPTVAEFETYNAD